MNTVDTILTLISEHGITKNKLLLDLGLGKNSFVNWTDRGTSPSGETLSKIADYFNVSVDYLLGRTASRHSAAPPGVSAEALLIAAAFDRATPKEQDTVRVVLSEYIASPSTGSKDKAV